MKHIKSIITVALLLLVTIANAQQPVQPVTDVQATAVAVQTKITTAATLTKTTAMLEQISMMKKKYDDMMENIEEVSSAIATGKQIINITQTIGKVNSNYQKAISYISNESSIKPQEKVKIISAFTKVVGECVDELDDAYSLSTTGSYKMSDSERMTLLKDIEKNVVNQNDFLIYFLNKVKKSVSSAKSRQLNIDFINKSNKSLKN